MCFPHPGMPATLLLEQRAVKGGMLLLTVGLVFGKVAAYRNGEHRTYLDFLWPIGRTVADPRARVGDHTFGLHFLASPACAPLYSSYDSHVLAVLPSHNVWDPVMLPTPQLLTQETHPPRCWHASGATTLQCLTCEGVKLADIDKPDFWQDLTKAYTKSSRGLKFRDLCAANSVWHRQVTVKLW